MHNGVFGEIVYSTRTIYVLPLIICNMYTYKMVDRYSSEYYVCINAYVHGVAGPLRSYRYRVTVGNNISIKGMHD